MVSYLASRYHCLRSRLYWCWWRHQRLIEIRVEVFDDGIVEDLHHVDKIRERELVRCPRDQGQLKTEVPIMEEAYDIANVDAWSESVRNVTGGRNGLSAQKSKDLLSLASFAGSCLGALGYCLGWVGLEGLGYSQME
jgi:hypothetical protein